MDIVMTVINFLKSDVGVGILSSLFVLSEALANIPSIKANSVFQLLQGLLAKLTQKAV